MSSARYLFAAAYWACLEQSVLVLAKLTIKHRDSISIHYLLNQAENNTELFDSAAADEVVESIRDHRALLQDYATLINTARAQRDRVIAHLDRKNINDPPTILAAPVNMNEVEECYQALLTMLNAYKGYYDDSELYLSHIDEMVQEDISYLARLMKESNRRGVHNVDNP